VDLLQEVAMNEMIERVASAMLQKAFRNPECIDWDRGTVNFMPLARAAIEAMREPTEDMEQAALESAVSPKRTWQAMIAEALR
jgi:hypothetical protein